MVMPLPLKAWLYGLPISRLAEETGEPDEYDFPSRLTLVADRVKPAEVCKSVVDDQDEMPW